MGCCVPQFAGELIRSFVCIEIPDGHRAKLARLAEEQRGLGGGIRWLKAETLHITLKFCGERPQELVDTLAKRLAEMKKCGPFEISLNGVGGFPKLEKARIIWTGIEGETEKLCALAKNAARLAESCGMDREEKAFTPHVTLGRRTEFGALPENVVSALRNNALRLAPWTVDEIVLMRSRLLPSGAQYIPIKRFKI